MEHNLLTLDFWQDSVTYEGSTVPTGALGCEALNIPDAVIEKLNTFCAPLNGFMRTLNMMQPDLTLLSQAKDSALAIIKLLSDVPPFSRLDHAFYSKWVKSTFVPEAVQEWQMANMAMLSGGLTLEQQKQYKRGLRLARLLPVFANLGFSLGEYKQTMTGFAVKMDTPNSDRSPDGLAKLFGKQFPPALSFTDDGAWMAVTNTSLQYTSVLRPGCDVPMLVKRIHFVTFVGLLRADFFEGLCVGHAPKKCPICGRWFLTANARHTKYCGNPAPGDQFGRTCRQIGNLKGREHRELSDDHPIKLVYTRRLNTINHCIHRGTLDAELAKAMKKLAKDKMLRALIDSRYAKGRYQKRNGAGKSACGTSKAVTNIRRERGGADMAEFLTRREAECILQLSPKPPAMAALNDYILAYQQEESSEYFLYFLHHYEKQLNRYLYSFLRADGYDGYDPERFLDLKFSCVELLLQKARDYDPKKGAAFTTYVYPYLEDQMLRFRMQEEAWSFASLDEYKKVRQAAWMLGNGGDAVREFAEKNGCDLKTAEAYIKTAQTIRNRESFYVTEQDEDNEDVGEDVTRDDSWDYTTILWNGIRADAVQTAFEKLDFREQTLLEKRNAICMTCGRVGSWKGRPTFEDLAVLFEGTTAGGAERAYRRAAEHQTELLVEDGILRCVRLKLESQKRQKKKNAAAVYLYQADNDGDWGEIYFDFERGTAEIVRLADWDTMRTNIYAKMVIRYVMKCKDEKLPKEILLGFER